LIKKFEKHYFFTKNQKKNLKICEMNLFKNMFFAFIVVNIGFVVSADEEDDLGELLIDFGSGVAVAACEADETCRTIMVLITIPILIITGCIVCFGDEEDEYRYEPPSTRRIMTVGAGYMIGRQFIH
jgi:hypothetical protein